MTYSYNSQLTANAAEFLVAFHSLQQRDQKIIMALLIENMQHGQINEANSTNYANIFEPGYTVLTPDKIGLGDGSVIASDILSMVPHVFLVGSPPLSGEPIPLDVAQASIRVDQCIYRVQGIFYDLQYTDKLAVLAELFYMVGDGELDLNSELIPDGREIAANLYTFLRQYKLEAGQPGETDDMMF